MHISGSRLSKTPPKFHERTLQREREREKKKKTENGGGRGKKERNFGRSSGGGSPKQFPDSGLKRPVWPEAVWPKAVWPKAVLEKKFLAESGLAQAVWPKSVSTVRGSASRVHGARRRWMPPCAVGSPHAAFSPQRSRCDFCQKSNKFKGACREVSSEAVHAQCGLVPGCRPRAARSSLEGSLASGRREVELARGCSPAPHDTSRSLKRFIAMVASALDESRSGNLQR